MRINIRLTLPALTLALLTAACGGSDNALAPQFQPEVVNTPNVVFSLQATGLTDVSDIVSYSWSVSSGSIVIHPATNTASGTVTLNVKDAGGTVIYNGNVPTSGDITPPTGSAGPWQVRLTLSNYTGTVNFALQMQ